MQSEAANPPPSGRQAAATDNPGSDESPCPGPTPTVPDSAAGEKGYDTEEVVHTERVGSLHHHTGQARLDNQLVPSPSLALHDTASTPQTLNDGQAASEADVPPTTTTSTAIMTASADENAATTPPAAPLARNTAAQVNPKAHIAAIRAAKHIDKPSPEDDEIVQDLEESLNMQLYTENTHFLWELLQNADDNQYHFATLPTVDFEMTDGFLLVSSNEKGFKPENVEALCKIGKSTKKLNKETSIGEKGIGFKSVFRVATKVWISSNAYTFMFNRDGLLGKICPIWEKFPRSVEKDKTYFLLQLSDEKRDLDQKALRTQLRELDGALILFLRNLRKLNIRVTDGRDTRYGTKKSVIQRSEYEDFGGECSRIITSTDHLRSSEKKVDYVVVRHNVSGMPMENARKGQSLSEVVLAFPFSGNIPKLSTQKAFAFLPIRSTTFRFLTQADFVLTASREDILRDNEWNQALLHGLAECFLVAVSRFNCESSRLIRYKWMSFLLGVDDTTSGLLEDLGSEIFQTLKSQATLEDQLGVLERPCKMRYVPEEFRDRDGSFMFAKESQHHYLSKEYDAHWAGSQSQMARGLGIRTVDKEHFIEALRHAATVRAKIFREHPGEWHQRLANILIRKKLASIVLDIPLIPLHTGEWVSSDDGECFFPPPGASAGMKLPKGVDSLPIVDPVVASDHRRRILFEQFKVKELKIHNIYEAILKLHSGTEPPTLEIDELVTHFEFCFNHYKHEGSKPPEKRKIARPTKFWVLDRLGHFQPASTVYHDKSVSSGPRASAILAGPQWASRLVSGDLIRRLRVSKDDIPLWIRFFEDHLNFKSQIRVSDDGANFTDEFTYVIKNSTTTMILDVIITSWDQLPAKLQTNTLRQRLGAVVVICRGGQKLALNKTFRPQKELVEAGVEGVPFLDIEEPDHERWQKLAPFGVVVEPNLQFHLFHLSTLQSNIVAKATVEAVYRKIEFCCLRDDPHLQVTRSHFDNHDAFYIPDEKAWVGISVCVWEPTPTVRSERALSRIYPDRYSLFNTILRVRTASIGSVVAELVSMAPPNFDEPVRRKKLLRALSAFLRKDFQKDPGSANKVAGHIDMLRDKLVMPLKIGSLAPLNLETWYFKDVHDFGQCFADMNAVPLADFSVAECSALEALAKAVLVHFGKEHRLSRVVKLRLDVGVGSEANITVTNVIRGRAKYIRSILRDVRADSGTDLDDRLMKLQNLKVFRAPLMGAIPYIERIDGGPAIEGRPLKSEQVMLKDSPTSVNVYVSEKRVSSSLLREISAKLASHYKIKNDTISGLLEMVLAERRAAALEDKLVKANVDCGDDMDYEPMLLDQRHDEESLSLDSDDSGDAKSEDELLHANRAMGPLQSRPARRYPQHEDLASVNQTSSGYGESSTTASSTVRAGRKTIVYSETSSSQYASNGSRSSASDSAVGMLHHESVDGLATSRPRPQHHFSSESPHTRRSDRKALQTNSTFAPSLGSRMSYTNGFVPRGDQGSRIRTEEDKSRERAIGFQGELLTFHWLQEIFGDDAATELWTSELRVEADLPAWVPVDRSISYTDFTIPDINCKFSKWLESQHGVKLSYRYPYQDVRTFHIEVKSTSTHVMPQPFHMSSSQWEMAERMKGDDEDVYLVFQWYMVGIEGANPELKVVRNPAKGCRLGKIGRKPTEWIVWEKE